MKGTMKSFLKIWTNRRSLKRILAAALLPVLLFMLSGCGNQASSTDKDALRDKIIEMQEQEDAQEAPASVEETVQSTEEETVPEEEVQDIPDNGVTNFTEVYLKARYNNEWDEKHDHKMYLSHDYEQVAIGKEDSAKYPELVKSLAVVNDLIATEEANCYMSNMSDYQSWNSNKIDEAFENYLLPFKEDWKIYSRRADSAVFSLLTVNTDYASMDYNRVHYVGYNFDPATGKDIELSDIIKDEETLIGVLAKKAQEIMRSEMPDEIEYEEGGMADEIRRYLETDIRGNWTLDPEGISFWFDSYTLLPTGMHLSVLFADDTEGKIFTDSYRDQIPENWSMYLPLNTAQEFLADDRKDTDTVTVGESYGYYGDDNEYEYVDGLIVLYNDSEEKFELGDEITTEGIALVHLHDQTYMLTGYSEYDWGFLNTYAFLGGKVKKVCEIMGSVESIPFEELEDEDYMIPQMLLSDPTDIEVSRYTDVLSTCAATQHYELDEDGVLTPVEGYFTIQKDSRFELTSKYDLSGLSVVDEQTHEVMSTKVDLKKGDKCTLEFTDDKSYADVRLKDGTLVRIVIKQTPDSGRLLPTDEGDKPMYDAFEGQFFAG